MARHLSTYLWTAMKDGSRKPAEATRWMKAWGSAAGWPLAWSTDDWRQNSSDNRRSRTTASSLARIRCRARTRAWRARIRQSPLLLIGVSKFSIRRPFPDISGHSAPGSGSDTGSVSLSDSGMTGWCYGREWFPGLGTGKCQPGRAIALQTAASVSEMYSFPRPGEVRMGAQPQPRLSRRSGNPEPFISIDLVGIPRTPRLSAKETGPVWIAPGLFHVF